MTSRSAEHRNRSQRLLFFTNFRHHSETGFWPKLCCQTKRRQHKKKAGFKCLWDIRPFFPYRKEIPRWFVNEVLLASIFAIHFGVLNFDTGWFHNPIKENNDFFQVI
jgi:hypothetical protein